MIHPWSKSTRSGFAMALARLLTAALLLCTLGERPEGVRAQAVDDCLSGTHPCRAEGGGTHVKKARESGVSCLNDTHPCKGMKNATGVNDTVAHPCKAKFSGPGVQADEEDNVACLNRTHPRTTKSLKRTCICVEEGGTDNETCLYGKHPCKTFGYAVQVLHPPFSQVNGTHIFVNYSHNFTVTTNKTVLQVSGLNNILIWTGSSSVITLTCPDMGTGLAFKSSGVIIWNIKWVNCAIQHNTTVRFGTQIAQAYSSLFFFQCHTVLVQGCVFTSNRGNGISVYDGAGEIEICNTSFTNIGIAEELRCIASLSDTKCSRQSTGLYIESTLCGGFETCIQPPPPAPCQYRVDNCTFEGNNNLHAYPTSGPELTTPFGKGGGMGVSLLGNVYNQNVTINGSQFIMNKALHRGGGIDILLYGVGTLSYITVANSTFNSNTVLNGAGGRISLGLVANSTKIQSSSLISTVWLSQCHIVENFAARWGGSMCIYTNGVQSDKEPFNLTMEVCMFINNSVEGSAAALGVSRWKMRQGGTVFTPRCIGCTFKLNHIQLGTKRGSGVVYLQEIPMTFENSTFSRNSETGL